MLFYLVFARRDDKLVCILPNLARRERTAEIVNLIFVRELKLDLGAKIKAGRKPANRLVVQAEHRGAGGRDAYPTHLCTGVLNGKCQHEEKSSTYVFEEHLRMFAEQRILIEGVGVGRKAES